MFALRIQRDKAPGWQPAATPNAFGVPTSSLAAAEAHDRRRADAALILADVAKELTLPDEVRRPELRAFAASTAEFIGKQADTAEKAAAGANRVREVLEHAKTSGEAWQKMVQGIADCERRLKKANALEARLGIYLQSARNLSRAATSAKTRLLEKVFNERLNGLWRELFIRLAKDEHFYPHLADPRTVRGSIRTTIEGCRDGITPFEQFAAIASSGNLNTAALSLFLSLNLVEQPRHRFIVLDDPVQAMDDLRVVQLANLLREIRRQARRQLILAVHERALFDYLCLELGPTDPNTNLLSIELTSAHDGVPNVTFFRHEWKPDKVQFGA